MLVAGVIAAGVAALYPAWLAVKLRPAEALRG
jgi:ABC-type lipoprotein release transport system permease subunit